LYSAIRTQKIGAVAEEYHKTLLANVLLFEILRLKTLHGTSILLLKK